MLVFSNVSWSLLAIFRLFISSLAVIKDRIYAAVQFANLINYIVPSKVPSKMLIRSHVKLFQVCLADMPASFVRSIANFTPTSIRGEEVALIPKNTTYNLLPDRRRIHFKLGKSCDVMSNE